MNLDNPKLKLCDASECKTFTSLNVAFCDQCSLKRVFGVARATFGPAQQTIAQKYPKYYKDVSGINELDIYMIHKLFDIQDSSGALQHSSKKLLLSGVRTGGKSKYDDIKEARDTLTRWLDMNKPT